MVPLRGCIALFSNGTRYIKLISIPHMSSSLFRPRYGKYSERLYAGASRRLRCLNSFHHLHATALQTPDSSPASCSMEVWALTESNDYTPLIFPIDRIDAFQVATSAR